MNDNKKIESLLISQLRFPLAVLVVLVHCMVTDYSNYNPEAPLGSFDGMFTAYLNIWNYLGHCTTPCFFLISGFLFFYKNDTLTFEIYKDKLKKRASSLLRPYLFWVTFAYLLSVFANVVGQMRGADLNCSQFFQLVYDQLTAHSLHDIYWRNPGTGCPYYLILWYVRDLILLSLLTPVIYLLTRYVPWLFLAVLFGTFFTDTLQLPVIAPRGYFFFSLGAILSLKKWNIPTILENKIFRYVSIFFILVTFGVASQGITDKAIYNIARFWGVILIFSIALYTVRKQKMLPDSLGHSGFFIYCTHILQPASGITVLALFTWLFMHTLCKIPYVGPILSFPLVPIATALFLHGIYLLGMKIWPWGMKFVTGKKLKNPQ